jgi:ubiquinone/menaquinone biosynthesis C-methylase UbiE
MTQNIGSGFRDADGELFDALVGCLDFMSNLPFFRAYKSHSWESLKIEDGQIILDVACGTGSDLITLAGLRPRTRFIGVDRSKGFIELAKMRAEGLPNLEFLQGDGHRLPLADRVVDAARIDRSLQHMESPGAVLAEMVRVTKDEGRIVACEPD